MANTTDRVNTFNQPLVRVLIFFLDFLCAFDFKKDFCCCLCLGFLFVCVFGNSLMNLSSAQLRISVNNEN